MEKASAYAGAFFMVRVAGLPHPWQGMRSKQLSYTRMSSIPFPIMTPMQENSYHEESIKDYGCLAK